MNLNIFLQTHMKIELSELRDVLVTTFSSSQVPGDVSELKMNDIDEWDSLGNFTLLLAVEEKFNVKFDLIEMPDLNSVSSIIRALEHK
jgi:acyl carrier protein